MAVVLTTLLLTVATSVLILLYRHYTKLSRHGISGPTPLPFIGNLHQTIKPGFVKMDPLWEKQYGKIYGYYQGLHPVVAISNPEVLKTIFVKSFTNFTNRPVFGNIPKLLSNGVVFMRGKTWKRTRNIITPTFSSGKLKQMVPVVNKYATLLTDNLLARTGESVVVKKYFGQFTMDTITATSFGLDINSQKDPDNPFMKHISLMIVPSKKDLFWLLMTAIVPGFSKVLKGLSGFTKEGVQFFEDTGHMLVEERKTNKQVYNDFMYLLINARMEGPKSGNLQDCNTNVSDRTEGDKTQTDQLLSDDEVVSQAFVFFLAGYETTSNLLRFAAYVLATRPDLDDKLWREIHRHIDMTEPTYETVGELKYMDQFLYEVLRFYPPLTRLTRETEEDIEIAGKTIPKGTVVAVPVWSIHHNEEYYPEPELFNPDRFPGGQKVSPDSTTFLAFGAGPRQCIGTRLALLEAKLALVHVLRKVKFVKSEKTQENLELTHGVFLSPSQPIEVLITNRQVM